VGKLSTPFLCGRPLHLLLTLRRYHQQMIGTKSSQVFTSRWMALRWSLGVMALAYCSVPSAEPEAKTAGSQSELEQANAILQASSGEAEVKEETQSLSSLEADYQAKIEAMQQFEAQ
jgi:hypothetical protein